MFDLVTAPPSFPPAFATEYRPSDINRGDLVIVFSSAHGFAFYRSQFRAPTLFISDKLNLYYMKGFKGLCKRLHEFIDQRDFSRIVFVGISKAGWACLVLSNLFADRDFSRTYHCLVFSPQTRLYPENQNITVPSYRRMIKRVNSDPSLKKIVSRYGTLPDINQFNIVVNAYYGSRHGEDTTEAIKLSGVSVTLRPLPLSGHLSHLPFVADTSNRVIAARLVDIAMAQGAAIGDSIAEAERDQFIDELVHLGKQPNIVDLTHGVLNQIAPLKLIAAAILCNDFTEIVFQLAENAA